MCLSVSSHSTSPSHALCGQGNHRSPMSSLSSVCVCMSDFEHLEEICLLPWFTFRPQVFLRSYHNALCVYNMGKQRKVYTVGPAPVKADSHDFFTANYLFWCVLSRKRLNFCLKQIYLYTLVILIILKGQFAKKVQFCHHLLKWTQKIIFFKNYIFESVFFVCTMKVNGVQYCLAPKRNEGSKRLSKVLFSEKFPKNHCFLVWRTF